MKGQHKQAGNGASLVVERVELLSRAGKVCVNQETLFELLDLNDGRSAVAAYQAAKRFRDRFGIEKLAGGLFPLAQIERARRELAGNF